jgi:hypothetical protein
MSLYGTSIDKVVVVTAADSYEEFQEFLEELPSLISDDIAYHYKDCRYSNHIEADEIVIINTHEYLNVFDSIELICEIYNITMVSITELQNKTYDMFKYKFDDLTIEDMM